LIGGFTGRLMAGTSMRALMRTPVRPRHAVLPCLVHALAAVACLGAAALLAPVALAADDDDVRRAREAVASGTYVPLETLIADALERVPGQVVDVDLDIDDDEYEIEVLDEDGVVWELEYDARTGRLTDLDRDD
jgi:uncharacterized membrane protein YkoI